MYKLAVQFQDGSTMGSVLKEKQLKSVFKSGLRGVIKWATVTTPSGVTRDVTSKLQMI